jgi:hypothetical protein
VCSGHVTAITLDEERPCLHCMIVELIDDFFAEYPATAGSDKVDTEEAEQVIDAIAKTVAELTSQQDCVIRQQVIEHLMRQIRQYDAEFRREGATSAVSSLTRSTDGGSGRLSTGSNSTPPPCWTGRGVIWRCKRPLQKYRRPQNRGLSSALIFEGGTVQMPCAIAAYSSVMVSMTPLSKGFAVN